MFGTLALPIRTQWNVSIWQTKLSKIRTQWKLSFPKYVHNESKFGALMFETPILPNLHIMKASLEYTCNEVLMIKTWNEWKHVWNTNSSKSAHNEN